MDRPADLTPWLLSRLPADGADPLAELCATADRVRRLVRGDRVYHRAIIEIGNVCRRNCHYCGLRAERDLPRYRMTDDEILDCGRSARERGFDTLVIQGGEDPAGFPRERVATLVRRLRTGTGLPVTLSLGERSEGDLAAWREAGADRYLLKLETTRPDLYARIHPALAGEGPGDRLALLGTLRRLGYAAGTGLLVGLPGQTPADLVADLLVLADFQPDMVSIGPFVPHPETPLGRTSPSPCAPGDLLLRTRAMVALARLLCPRAAIPSTTSTGVLDPGERTRQLEGGADVLMEDVTPERYRMLYDLYPGKGAFAGGHAPCDAC